MKLPAWSARARGSRKLGGATIADVAARAQFAPMTVSRVINGVQSVKPSARKAILAAIAELNYSPNMAARTLAGAQAVRLGLLYSSSSASVLGELLVGAMAAARESLAQLFVEKCDSEEQAAALVRRCVAGGIDGFILAPPLCDSKYVHRALVRAGALAVALASATPPLGLTAIRIDDRSASAAMTRFIVSLGHQRIGFIGGDPLITASACRLDGYRMALKEAGLPVDKTLIRAGAFTYRSGLRAASHLLEIKRPPTAIFASNDDMAAAAVVVAQRHGLEVPKQLTVCGFDDTFFSRSIRPALTTVRQPIAAMAGEAITSLVKMVMARRDGRQEEPLEPSVLGYSLVRRDSHGPVPV